MERIELLLPAGNKDCLRAAVANGADAVYLGLDAFNARSYADNFRAEHLGSVVGYCHDRGVRVYVTANILVKNDELEDFLGLVRHICRSGADAVIVQDPFLIPLIRKAAPDSEVHVSTQATIANRFAVPKGADRVIVPRELGLEQIRSMAGAVPVEMFVHGALCLSYSGQCLFSSMAGGRSGNRGRCAQPCRYMYNGQYPLSTMDLCLLQKLPEIIGTGAVALKVEGRMRTPLYVGTVARIYRKYIDSYYLTGDCSVDEQDIEQLMLAFNRDFTTGFAFNDSIVDPDFGMNRGVFLGTFSKGLVTLQTGLKVGDGVMSLHDGKKAGNAVDKMWIDGEAVSAASRGQTIKLHVKGAQDGDEVYKTSSADKGVELGEDFTLGRGDAFKPYRLSKFPSQEVRGLPQLFVRARTPQAAGDAADSGAGIIYYDMFDDRMQEAREAAGEAKFFLASPRIMDDGRVEEALRILGEEKPAGALIGDRGLLAAARERMPELDIHLDQSLNVFNDAALAACGGIPIISPELSFKELAGFRSKRFIVMAHGPLVLMTTKEPLSAGTLEDESGRVFRTRKAGEQTEVLNCSDLGLFNLTGDLVRAGIKWFYLDPAREVGKTVRIYRRILSSEEFDDRKIRRGYTTGHFRRGVE